MKHLIERASESLAEVLVQTDKGPVRNGTAFAVSTQGRAATCLHVIDGHKEYLLQFWGETVPRKAKVAIQDASHDLAVLEVAGLTRPLQLGSYDAVDLGSDVLWGGFPWPSLVPSFHRGMVSFKGALPLPSTSVNTDCFQLDGTSNKGNSGGPLIDPVSGSVVGIISSALGGLDEELEKLVDYKSPVTVTFANVNHLAAIQGVIKDLHRHLQLGVAYGISARYLHLLLKNLGS